MSTTSVYALFNTKVTLLSELRNGHGSGPPVWDYISLKLTGEKFQMFDRVKAKAFWELWKDKRLNWEEKAVLLSTFDSAYIETEHLGNFADACRSVHKRIIEDTPWDWSHWELIAHEASALHLIHDRRCLGLCVGCTSVSDPWEEFSNCEPWGVCGKIDSLANIHETETA
jgi:hypothetical protein